MDDKLIQDILTIFPHVVATLSLGISLLALLISYFAFRRDDANLDLTVSIGKIISAEGASDDGLNVIFIKVVNIGRRAAILSSFGADTQCWAYRLICKCIPFWFEPSAMMFVGWRVNQIVQDIQGNRRVLHDGEEASLSLPLDESKEMLELITSKARNFHIFDSKGKCWKQSKSGFKKLKKDAKNYLASDNS